MHGTNRSYLPSTMFSPAMPRLTSPAVAPPSTSTPTPNTPRASANGGSASAMLEAYRDGGPRGGGSSSVASALAQYRSSQQADAGVSSSTAAAAASYYASRMRREGFPYGLSGVPSMPNYNYSGELYNYVSNGFPRKSRICTFCSKVFTRSTTRRYHEKRCPMLRAASSLMQGNKEPAPPSLDASRASPPSNGPVSDADGGRQGVGSRPPPPLVLGTDSPSPPAPAPSSSAMMPSPLATSLGLASLARSHTLNASQFYNLYGSHALTAAMATPTTSALTSAAVTSIPPRPSSVDQNRNSVLSAGKKMSEPEVREGRGGEIDDASRESDSLRHRGGSHSQDGGQQQPMFSPLSATSRTPSEEDRGSEEGDQVPFKQPLGVNAKPGLNLNAFPPFLNPYHLSYRLAALRANAGLAGAGTEPFSGNAVRPADKLPPLLNADSQDVIMEDKEEASPRDDNPNNQEDEDTDHYSNPNTDIQESFDVEEKRTCGICKEEFTHEKKLLDHLGVHQKYTPSCCRFCGRQFSSQSQRISHQGSHTLDCTLDCAVCGIELPTKFALRQHIRRKHCSRSAEEVTCRFCFKAIDGGSNLRSHLLSHRQVMTQSEQLSLRYLPPSPASPQPVFVDSEEEEEDEEAASQDVPPPSTDSKTSLDSPPQELGSEPAGLSAAPPASSSAPVVAGDSPVQQNGGREAGGAKEKEWCRICQKELPKSQMRYHEKEHAGQKPYECGICKKRFGYKNNMKSHMKLHAGIKPYQCSICLAKFTRGSTLRRHARRHGWDMYPGAPGLQDRALLSQVSAAMLAKKALSGSPPAAGARAMKADPALLASMGKPDMAALGKKYDASSFSTPDAVRQNMLETYRNLPQAVMFPPGLTASQYLGFNPAFPPVLPPPVVPQQNDQPVDFSMPAKKRQRTLSSSSASSTPVSAQGLGLHGSLASRLASSPSVSAAGSQPVSSASLEGRSASKAVDGKAGMKGEEGFRSSMPHPHYHYHNKPRASLSETVERLMINRNNAEGSSQASTQGVLKQDAEARSAAADASPRDAFTRSLLQFSKRNGGPDSISQSFRHRDTSSRSGPEVGAQEAASCKRVAQDFSSQVELCCQSSPVGSRAPDRHRQEPGSPSARASSGRDPLQQETMASLLQSGRLLCCSHCDLYFTDRAMYRLHQRLHPTDRPFLCFICQLDCQDRTAFSNHLMTHLK